MSKHIVIIAGEESGDAHAAQLVKALRARKPDVHITGIGGAHMERAGVTLISDLARFGVTGLVEIAKHAFVIKKAFKAIKAHLEATKPDVLLLVDYPGFNLRIAAFAKQKLGLKVIYYISPQIWAWKANRMHKIKANVDKMAVILPFEKKLYEEASVPVSFVGHPLIPKISAQKRPIVLQTQLNIGPQQRIIAVLPGSRHNEIAMHMPILAQFIRNFIDVNTDVRFLIPVAETLDPEKIKSYLPHHPSIHLLKGQALDAIALSHCTLVASGTASLECALLEKPMCIFYKTARLTYAVASQVIRVPYLGLCNLLAQKMIVPELIQDDFNVEELTKTTIELLSNIALRTRMQHDLKILKTSLTASQADCSLIDLVDDYLQNN